MSRAVPATDADLGGPRSGPRAVVKLADAHGWWTTAMVAEGVTELGHNEPVLERSLLIRGRRGVDGRFVVQYLDGAATGGWWWSAEQLVTIPDSGGELYSWRTERPTPHKVSLTVIKKLLKGDVEWPVLPTSGAVRKDSAAPSARAARKVKTDGVS